jgi:hypothetical protein
MRCPEEGAMRNEQVQILVRYIRETAFRVHSVYHIEMGDPEWKHCPLPVCARARDVLAQVEEK